MEMIYSNKGAWTMMDDLMNMQGEFNRYFDGINRHRVTVAYPPVNAWISGDGLVVDAELPGVDPKNVEISVQGNELTVSGSRAAGELPKDATYERRERKFGGFRRTMELPFKVEADKVSAAYKNGVLRITLPRAESDKPRKVKIETA
ncbi:MAG: Hsp20/alpha crystallin family protein [Verrucomicrobia bacterium]|nr:Hsp20/alpha crystallin family protein [Verrucomicrobiota bacterium]